MKTCTEDYKTLREALEGIWKEVYFYAFNEEKQDFPHLQEAMLEDPPDYKSLRNSFFAIAHLVDNALAAPPRNCDVGTPKEQAARFQKFCRFIATQGREDCPDNCPCVDADDINVCQAAWGQMPYKERDHEESSQV